MNAVAEAILNLTVAEAVELGQSMFDRLPKPGPVGFPDPEAVTWWLTDWAASAQEDASA